MATLKSIIQRLLPSGSRPDDKPQDWQFCPEWPPDVFAVVATLLERCDMYSKDRYSGRVDGNGPFGKRYRKNVADLGLDWGSNLKPPSEVEGCWRTLMSRQEAYVSSLPDSHPRWWDSVFKLLAVADEASVGMGFVPSGKPGSSTAANLVLYSYHRKNVLPYMPYSLCLWVWPDRACVMPKSRTSQVGCTLRSLSHHLALVPPITQAQTVWTMGFLENEGPLNLLLVPFPYRIQGNSFKVGDRPINDDADGKSYYFRVQQTWLKGNIRREFLPFLKGLIAEAEREFGRIHGLVLPELALDSELAQSIAATLVGRNRALEIFISGAYGRGQSSPGRNTVLVSMSLGRGRFDWFQNKHHRWRLDRGQIRRYHLGHEFLEDHRQWWEEISIQNRSIHFALFRPGATICTLICEDLARMDPIQPILRSVGPNLVVALLMDGPQLERRWPGKYATVLADDPGSAVLTLTSLGMVRRSAMPGDIHRQHIALWKSPGGDAQELILPEGAHALALTVNSESVRNWTLDGRTENFLTRDLSLGGVHAITHPRPPKWAS
jgi:hypothetical protein